MMLSLFTDGKKAGLGENLQVMRDCRLGQREATADLAAGEFSGKRDLPQHLKALGVGQSLERSYYCLVIGYRRFTHRFISIRLNAFCQGGLYYKFAKN